MSSIQGLRLFTCTHCFQRFVLWIPCSSILELINGLPSTVIRYSMRYLCGQLVSLWLACLSGSPLLQLVYNSTKFFVYFGALGEPAPFLDINFPSDNRLGLCVSLLQDFLWTFFSLRNFALVVLANGSCIESPAKAALGV